MMKPFKKKKTNFFAMNPFETVSVIFDRYNFSPE